MVWHERKNDPKLGYFAQKGAKFSGCLHEEDLKLSEVSCCFPSFMLTLCIKQGFYAVNHIKTNKNWLFHGKFMCNLS